jgi:hypothetical protein
MATSYTLTQNGNPDNRRKAHEALKRSNPFI